MKKKNGKTKTRDEIREEEQMARLQRARMNTNKTRLHHRLELEEVREEGKTTLGWGERGGGWIAVLEISPSRGPPSDLIHTNTTLATSSTPPPPPLNQLPQNLTA
jgi:hypothetical protein